MDDEDRLRDLGERAEERVRNHYSWERITDEFQQLFDDLDRGRPPKTTIGERV
jgi:glycosyltransferase involved in cell wall biosynthesis